MVEIELDDKEATGSPQTNDPRKSATGIQRITI